MRLLPVSVVVSCDAHTAEAALDARIFAIEAGLASSDVERVATVVSELASNIVKYADRGRITLRCSVVDGSTCVEIEARDRGPGIESIERAMDDHHSTSGTLGLGLPGARRLMDQFEIRSTPGEGTVVRALKCAR